MGEVQRLPVITIALEVGSTEKENKQVTYTPPPGWYVRGHSVDCLRKVGYSSFTVSTVPQNWSWSSEDKIRQTYKLLIDMATKAHNANLQAKFATEQDQLLEEFRKVRSTHHALVVDATAKGEGFLRSKGALQLTVMAELVYVGTEEDLARTVTKHKAGLEGPSAKQKAGLEGSPAKHKPGVEGPSAKHKTGLEKTSAKR